jgi:DNA-binding NarL/FixJ family response regulator
VARHVTDGRQLADGAPEAQTAAPIRVAIVDDHPVVRDGTASLLAGQPGIEVVATGGSLEDAVRLLGVDAAASDVLVLDVRLGTQSGLEALTGRVAGTRPAVVVVTAYDYPQYAAAALRLGASGFVLKMAPVGELVDAIRRAAAGGLAFATRPEQPVALTRREAEIVRLLVDGLSNDEIAGSLTIGTRTVETHLRRLFGRLEVASRTELVARALREGWLELPLDP